MLDEHDVMNVVLVLADRFSKTLEGIDKEKYPVVWNKWKEKNDTITMFISNLQYELSKKREQLNETKVYETKV